MDGCICDSGGSQQQYSIGNVTNLLIGIILCSPSEITGEFFSHQACLVILLAAAR
jgi:hypothetical protein